MKKTFIICICTLLLFLGVLTWLVFLPKIVHLSIEKVAGNANLMQDISWEGYYSSGVEQYVIDVIKDQTTIQSTQASGDEDVEMISARKSYFEDVKAKASTTTSNNCIEEEMKLDTLHVRYELDLSMSGYGIVKVNTNLIASSNEVYQLLRRQTVCATGINPQSEAYQEVYASEKDMHKLNYLYEHDYYNTDHEEEGLMYYSNGQPASVVKLSNQQYIMLPTTDAYTNGEVELYDIQVSKDKENKVYSKANPLGKLTQGRSYEGLRLLYGNLVILSHDEESVYVTTMNTNGEQLHEVVIPYPKQTDGVEMTTYENDQYLILYDGKQSMVIDTSLGILKNHISCQEETITDLYYKNELLYMSSFHTKQRMISFDVFQDQTNVYQSEISLNQQILSDDGFYLYETMARFKR